MNYETMYILRPDMNDEQVDQAITKYQNFLKEQGAEEIEITHRGRRRLAYEIDRHREGIYIQMNYVAAGSVVAALERSMRLGDEVIRYLTVKPEPVVEEEVVEEAPAIAE